MKDSAIRLRKFKKENIKKTNSLHKNAFSRARKIACKFNRSLSTEVILPPYIVDIYFNYAKIAIEIDGGIHNDQEAYDNRRDNFLKEKYGVSVIRLKKEDVIGLNYNKVIWWAFFKDSIEIIKKNCIRACNKKCGDSIPEEVKLLLNQ